MSLYSIAKNHCGNNDGGKCLLKGDCLIGNGKPCRYFKDAVWKAFDPAYPHSREHNIYQANIKEFQLVYGLTKPQDVRVCGCGEVLRKRQRLCDKCADKNRKASYRASKAKTRQCPVHS